MRHVGSRWDTLGPSSLAMSCSGDEAEAMVQPLPEAEWLLQFEEWLTAKFAGSDCPAVPAGFEQWIDGFDQASAILRTSSLCSGAFLAAGSKSNSH